MHLERARHLREVDQRALAEITAETGITRTSLYRHFRRMDDQTEGASPTDRQIASTNRA